MPLIEAGSSVAKICSAETKNTSPIAELDAERVRGADVDQVVEGVRADAEQRGLR